MNGTGGGGRGSLLCFNLVRCEIYMDDINLSEVTRMKEKGSIRRT